MGRLTRIAAAVLLMVAGGLAAAPNAAGFDGFGPARADSTYGQEIRFSVELRGQPPERLELLLRSPGSETAFVVPVQATGRSATYVWDTAAEHVTPNTPITYRWRAVEADGQQILSAPAVHRYTDDRPGLDWQTLTAGDATVHWYGGAPGEAVHFAELTATGVQQAEELLGTRLAGPVDIFMYETRDDFFGALGPGAREWTGAAAFPELRTVFLWREGGSAGYLDSVLVHEVTHVVFHDATDNPFHEPARWLNEGIATWSETRSADGEQAIVELEAGGGGLVAFEAITENFPIDQRGGRLAYAEGTVMIDRIIEQFGTDAIGGITAAYRTGASDAEALEAGTGVEADALYADFYRAFGADPPPPVAPEPIASSDVAKPPSAGVGGGPPPGGRPDTAPEPGAPAGDGGTGALILIPLAIGVGLAVAAAVVVSRRARRRS